VIEKLGNIFDDPSSAGLTCVQTGTIVVKGIEKGEGGEEVFGESKNLIFKQIQVRRILDSKRNTLVYTAYSTRLDKNADQNKSRFKSSLCAVSLYTPSSQ
jgi:CreA protein